jgi:aryl-alcohol dehydrogenase-like predicted oxidoreductase
MQTSRREFVAATLAGAGALILGRAPVGAQAGAGAAADPFQLVPLGKTGLQVSLVGVGTGMRGGGRQSNQTRLGKEPFEALLRHAYDKGARFFDCADSYGTHPYVASALQGMPREQYVLSTKIWVHGGGLPEPERPDANIVVDRFRQELGTDYIDLVLLHCMMSPTWPEQQQRQLDILADLKAKGIIRAHGVSVHGLGPLRACLDNPWVESVHARINAYGDAMDDRDPAVVADVLKQLHEAGKGVVGMKLIGEGRYRNDPERRDRSIQYVLGLGCVDTMIVGFEKPEEVDDFATRVGSALAAQRG